MASHNKSTAYVEAMVRETVARVAMAVRRPMQEAGYVGPRSKLRLSDAQNDFLAGYIYGALQRLLDMSELLEESNLTEATHRLYCGLFELDEHDYELWHEWVVREGLHHLHRPHVFLGFCTGRNDIVEQLRCRSQGTTLVNALRHLAEP
jgi:hypothetical protein